MDHVQCGSPGIRRVLNGSDGRQQIQSGAGTGRRQNSGRTWDCQRAVLAMEMSHVPEAATGSYVRTPQRVVLLDL